MIREKFKAYYSRHSPPLPLDFGQREFGFGFETKIDYRHKAFANKREFEEYFAVQAPLYASHSCAVYRYPDARPMEKKEWLGADLVFDFDAPRLPKEHYASKEHNALLCPRCLHAVLNDALQLTEEFLWGDFGLSKRDTILVYSGNKGYHVHVRSNAVRGLRQEERRELLEYVNGPKQLLRKQKIGRVEVLRGPSSHAKGWHAKYYHEALKAIGSVEGMRQLGLSKPKATKILADAERVKAGLAKGNWDAFAGLEDFWLKVFEETKKKHALQPDAQVTLDLARLIRLPGSLHGGTGLIAATVEKPNFNPLRDAVAFSWRRMERVRLTAPLAVEMADEVLELKTGENEVPEAVAVLLEAKGKTLK